MEEKTVKQLRSILDLWSVTYNVQDEKYVVKSNSIVTLDANQLDWINNTMGLKIFSISKYEDNLIIKFSTGGGT